MPDVTFFCLTMCLATFSSPPLYVRNFKAHSATLSNVYLTTYFGATHSNEWMKFRAIACVETSFQRNLLRLEKLSFLQSKTSMADISIFRCEAGAVIKMPLKCVQKHPSENGWRGLNVKPFLRPIDRADYLCNHVGALSWKMLFCKLHFHGEAARVACRT